MQNNSKVYKFVIVLLLIGIFSMGSFLFIEESSGIHEIDNQGLEKVVKSNKEHLIYIGRPTCPYCQMVQPKLEKISKKNYYTLKYYNTDDARKSDEKKMDKLLSKIQIQSVPTVILVKENQVINKWDVVNDFEKINNYISKNKLNIF